MIFSPKLAHLVLAGKKTETRRLVKEGEAICRYHPGRTYAVQKRRGGRSQGRIEIRSAEIEQLGELTYEGALAEGFRSRDEFFEYWTELHGYVDHELLVWAISFRLVEEVRYLHRDSSHGYTTNPHLSLTEYGEGGEPTEPEPEPVDSLTMEGYAAEATARRVQGDDERVRAELGRIAALPSRSRMAELHKLASDRGVDVRDDVKAFERRVRRRLERAA